MDNKINRDQQITWNNVFVHILLWGVIFILPYFFMDAERVFNWRPFLRSLPELVGFITVFYVNYFIFIKRLLFKGKTKSFILYNILLIIFVAFFMYFSRGWLEAVMPHLRPRWRGHRGNGIYIMHIIRNSTSLFLILGLSVAFRMTFRLFEVDNERKELAKAKSEAELQNLKNQINPHFLLNTLNNIYALIEFDPPKAQKAVVSLSKLLRHLLYDNNQTFVPLRQEVVFVRNYIELMRIRLSENVKLSAVFTNTEKGNTLIPPLIFISLIENAFKHGISGDKPSFIDILLEEQSDGIVRFECSNSYFPKSESDKSGSGIGLGFVKRRLELLKPGSYTWETHIENDIYSTVLILDTKKIVDDTELLDS